MNFILSNVPSKPFCPLCLSFWVMTHYKTCGSQNLTAIMRRSKKDNKQRSKKVGPTTQSIRWWGQRFPWLTLDFVLSVSVCVKTTQRDPVFNVSPYDAVSLFSAYFSPAPHTAFYLQSIRVRNKLQQL